MQVSVELSKQLEEANVRWSYCSGWRFRIISKQKYLKPSSRARVSANEPGVGVMFRIQAGDIALVLLVAFSASHSYAAGIKPDDESRDSESGVVADRLSPKHQRTWQEIQKIIYAEDADGFVLHPTLRTLYEQLQRSDHTVYLEFDDLRVGCRCTAGEFSIERLDPLGSRHVAVIKLHLSVIEHAYADPASKAKSEFTPFAGLSKLDRYVEVFGHEMAHAVDILFSQERANRVDEIVVKANKLIRQRLPPRTTSIDADVARVIQKRDALLSELEIPAVAAEELVWQELTRSQGQRKP